MLESKCCNSKRQKGESDKGMQNKCTHERHIAKKKATIRRIQHFLKKEVGQYIKKPNKTNFLTSSILYINTLWPVLTSD